MTFRIEAESRYGSGRVRAALPGRRAPNAWGATVSLELDIPLAEFKAASASLTRPDALERLEEIVEATQLEGLYEDVFDERSL